MRLHERHGDRFTNCESVNFPDGRGRTDPNRTTPVATIEGIVEVVLLLTDTKAAAMRKKIVHWLATNHAI